MYERSSRQTATPEEMNAAIRRALGVLKGSDTPMSYSNIAKRAAAYSSASASFIEIYIKRLSDMERADLTIPKPVTPVTKRTGPSLSRVRVGWKAWKINKRA